MQTGSKTAVKLVVFDLDSTLFDHDAAVKAALLAVHGTSKAKSDEVALKYDAALQAAHAAYDNNEISYKDIGSRMLKLFFAAIAIHDHTDEEAKALQESYKKPYRRNRRATPGSIELLCRLWEKHYHVAVLSNGRTAVQDELAYFIGIRELVDCILTSDEVGVRKPATRGFQQLAERFGVAPEEIMMVGDSVEADIKGSCDAGVIDQGPGLETEDDELEELLDADVEVDVGDVVVEVDDAGVEVGNVDVEVAEVDVGDGDAGVDDEDSDDDVEDADVDVDEGALDVGEVEVDVEDAGVEVSDVAVDETDVELGCCVELDEVREEDDEEPTIEEDELLRGTDEEETVVDVVLGDMTAGDEDPDVEGDMMWLWKSTSPSLSWY
ncbi:Glyceraldehyde 3-phosphate phosphatase [Colletotrichum spinosum]|uniref:Glyceraldehyde 3-phosphate phosphatase n=1 Tax=Colletotrichum spinosum TaxID=1347390 RepID=A0A4R8QRD3_9PEZI|nr:Glyceraldehyde 3-phosphate phosphatase [Colletotrichum spinosum]